MLSIIIATHNSASKLSKSLNSILEQKQCRRIQIVVKNSGKDKTTQSVIAKYDLDINYIESVDSSIYQAWNQALAEVKYNWVLFLGDDDTLQSDVDVVNLLDQLPGECVIAYGRVNKEYAHHKYRLNGLPVSEQIEQLMDFNTIPHQAFFQHIDNFNNFRFKEQYKIAADYDAVLTFVIPVQNQKQKIIFWDTTISTMSYGGISSGYENAFAVFQEFKRIKVDHNIPNSFTFYLAFIKSFIKTQMWRISNAK